MNCQRKRLRQAYAHKQINQIKEERSARRTNTLQLTEKLAANSNLQIYVLDFQYKYYKQMFLFHMEAGYLQALAAAEPFHLVALPRFVCGTPEARRD